MAEAGYRPPESLPFTVAGGGALGTLESRLEEQRLAGDLSAHDQLVGRLLARVLCGGGGTGTGTCTEQELLDLEREAFLELCHTEATRQRIAHMLKSGKPLKN
jgi:3-hydroxyacyl-CoA dehydrogenase